jgi:hypothetical protein
MYTHSGGGAGQLPPVRKRAATADIIFCIDCTASMGPCIEAVVSGVGAFVTSLQMAGRVDYRLRLVAYRDLPYGDEMQITDFTPDAEQFRDWVHALDTRANDTTEESTLDAICVALNSDWRPGCHRSVIVFTDAAPHPRLHDTTTAPNRDGVAAVAELHRQSKALLFMLAPQDGSYREIARRQQVVYHALPTDDRRYVGLQSADLGKVLDFVGRSISGASQQV